MASQNSEPTHCNNGQVWIEYATMRHNKCKAGDGKSMNATRDTYKTPTLKTFGPVSVLTQAGTGAMDEGVMAMNVNRQMV